MPETITDKISISRVNISSPYGCQVKIIKCKKEAYWWIGMVSVCDEHLKHFCKLAGIDYNGVIKEFQNKYAIR